MRVARLAHLHHALLIPNHIAHHSAFQVDRSGLELLFAKVGACVGDGTPLIVLEECASELEQLAAGPPTA